jgi:hypothetical protein
MEWNVVILVSGVVLHLQPIAMLEIAESHQLVIRANGKPVFEIRKQGLFLGRSHVSENQSTALKGLVCPLPLGGGKLLAFFFFTLGGGNFEATPVYVELPTVITAHDPLFLDLAVFERGAPMAAMGVKDADPPTLAPENDQFFAKKLYVSGGVRQFQRQADGMPEAAHVLSARRPRTGFG